MVIAIWVPAPDHDPSKKVQLALAYAMLVLLFLFGFFIIAAIASGKIDISTLLTEGTDDASKARHPNNNTGSTQTCELDHLISLELGGADTLDNIWPQCGPPNVGLSERFFKPKDAVENFLARQVREGKMSLSDAQRGIASDWTQFLAAAEGCETGACE